MQIITYDLLYGYTILNSNFYLYISRLIKLDLNNREKDYSRYLYVYLLHRYHHLQLFVFTILY